jgi:hypothetical protein
MRRKMRMAKPAKKAARKAKKAAKQSKEQLVIAVLSRARELIAKRGGWITEIGAADKQGQEVPFDGKEACRFCATGALDRAAFDLIGEWTNLDPHINALGFKSAGALENWNDEQTSKKAVLELFGSAIARLEA